MKIRDFRASAANEKLERDTQSQVADAIRAISVLNMTQFYCLPQHYIVPWKGSGLQVFSPHDATMAPAT